MPTETIIVVGLGASAVRQADALCEFTTIGVNDVARFLSPTHLLVLDAPRRFTENRLLYIDICPAEVAWICHDAWMPRLGAKAIRKLHLQRFSPRANLDVEDLLHFRTSPFAAIHLAYKLGAKRIGVIGMDLLPDHHMSRSAKAINEHLASMRDKLAEKKVELLNCSKIANLPSLPFLTLEEF